MDFHVPNVVSKNSRSTNARTDARRLFQQRDQERAMLRGQPAEAPQPAPARTGLTRAPAPAMAPRPNQGGTMTRGGITTRVAPSAQYAGPSATQNSGGTMTRNGQTTATAPSARTAPTPAANRPNQGGTISRNGTTSQYAPSDYNPPKPAAVPAQTPQLPMGDVQTSAFEASMAQPQQPTAADLGFSSRGKGTPQGSDAMPVNPNVGGSGLYAKRFASPQAASLYDQYTRRIFGGDGMA